MSDTLSEKNNFTYLTASVVLLLMYIAVIDQFKIAAGQLMIQAAMVIVLASGVWSGWLCSRNSAKPGYSRAALGLIMPFAIYKRKTDG